MHKYYFILLSLIIGFPKGEAQNSKMKEAVFYEHQAKASMQSRFLVGIYKLIGLKKSSKRSLGQGNPMTRETPIAKISRQANLRVDTVEQHPIYYISPKGKAKKKHILYFHGGAYTEQFVKQHWLYLLKLMQKTNYTIVAPDYGLAPKMTFEKNLQQMLQLYRQLGEEVGYENIILMGDSAGAGLAVALALSAKDTQLPQPQKLLLLSPWLDLQMDNPEIDRVDTRDPMLNLEWLKASALAYAGAQTKLKNSLVSPIYADLSNMAPIALFIGGRDVLMPDCKLFRSKILGKEGQINYYYYPQMVHVWMLADFLPESKECFAQVLAELEST